MAHTLFSLLLLRRLSLSSPSPRLSRLVAVKPFTSSAPTSPPSSSPTPPSSDPAASSLSARMSFVFDQIDAIEKERSEKDETLQRIRQWRVTKNAQNPELESTLSKSAETASNSPDSNPSEAVGDRPLQAEAKRELELVHPWPEWIELMERLVQQNYFDHRRKDEEKMINDLGFNASPSRDSRVCESSGLDFKNFRLVQTAFLNFGKDRFDILRSLSRQDIQILVGLGCPSADKKVVFSAKLLRKHVHLDEGDVCSSCSLRNSCERAYLLTLKEDEARTIDIMRVLLDYGFDPLNQPLLKQKSVKTVVRKMLHQVVKLSSVPIDPNLPPPIFKKPPPKVKVPPPPPRKRVGRDDIEMKKGDWLCPKCDFMNFAKNCVCLQCDAKRPKRELLPGEWECPQCNFLNYRRNTVCFHCDCKRPLDEFTENRVQDREEGPRRKMEKLTNLSEASKSNAWNFDFDDDESDGADVAAFEYADSSVIPKGSSDNYPVREENFRKTNRDVRARDREYSDDDNNGRSTGFNDFDDEDDVDSYEIDTGNRSSVKMVSLNNLSEFEGDSGSEENSEGESSARSISRRGPKYPSKAKQPRRRPFSGSDDDELDSDSDNELSSNPKWKSSHVSDSRPKGKENRPWKDLSFVSDDELGFNSDMDDEPEKSFRPNRGKPIESLRRGNLRARDPFSDSESENDSRSFGNRSGRNAGPRQRDTKFRSDGIKNSRRKSFEDDEDDDDFGRSSRGSRSGFRGGKSFGSRTNDRKVGMRNDRRKSFEDDDDHDDRPSRNSRGSRTNNRSSGTRSDRRNSFEDDDRPRSSRGSNGGGFRGNGSGSRTSDRRGGSSNFTERKSGGFRKQGEKPGYGRDMGEKRSEDFKNSRRVIER